LEWLGDVVRMDGERTVRESLDGTPGRERERERKKDLDWGEWKVSNWTGGIWI